MCAHGYLVQTIKTSIFKLPIDCKYVCNFLKKDYKEFYKIKKFVIIYHKIILILIFPNKNA